MRGKKFKYVLLIISLFLIIPTAFATTIKETLTEGDGYDTISPNTFIIGVTKFSGNEIITAGKSATAGANDAMLYITKNGTNIGYTPPTIYYYIDSNVGWFEFDSNNVPKQVTDKETLKRLSNLDIYYISNVEKKISINYDGEEIDENSLPTGVEYKNNKLFVNSTIQNFEFKTISGNKKGFVYNKTTSSFIKDETFCYTVGGNFITNYDSECSKDVIIPTNIKGQEIIGIDEDAFKNKGIETIIIPEEITIIRSDAFADNNLKSVIIKEKYGQEDFDVYGNNVFGDFENIEYVNYLTRALNLYNKELTINHYKDLDLNTANRPGYGEDFFESYFRGYVYDVLKDNNLEFFECWDLCNFQEYKTELNDKGYGIKAISDKKYLLSFEKYFENSNGEVERVYTVSKEITINLKESGTQANNEIVSEAIKNIKTDTRLEGFGSEAKKTNNKYLEDVEDLYNVEFKQSMLGRDDFGDEKISHSVSYNDIFVYYEDVLYQIIPLYIVGENNYYNKKLLLENFENKDDCIEELFKKFEEDTGINNYEIIYKNNDNNVVSEIENNGAATDYYIYIRDKELNEEWRLAFRDYKKANLDTNGNTKASCFEFNNGVITGYNTNCGADVIIPSTINGITVTEIADGEYHNGVFVNNNIRSVSFPNTLQKIGSYSFYNNELETITIPGSVTTIEEQAFYYNKIKSLNLEQGIEYLGDSSFASNELETVIIPNTVTTIATSAFEDNNLKSLTLGTNVEDIQSYAFSYNKIETVVIPNSVTTIGSSAFYRNELKTLNLGTGVKIIEHTAFTNNKLEKVIIPSSVEEIGAEAFENNKIKELTIPNTVKIIGNSAFNNNQLSNDDAFILGREYNEETNEVTILTDTIVSYGGANRTNVVIPDEIKKIEDNAFYNNDIEKITLPYGLESIGSSAFSFNKLTNICVPDTVTSSGSAVFINNSFSADNQFIYTCDKEGNIDDSTLFSYAANDETSYDIDTLTIPKNVKKIFSYAFGNMSVNNLIVPYGVEEIDNYAFQGIYIKNPVTLPTSIKKIGNNIFQTMYSAEDEDDYFVYGHDASGNIDKTILMAYRGLSYLLDDKKIIIPEGIEKIYDKAFQGTIYDDVEIIFPSTLKEIGDYVFCSCYQITEINLPDGIERIGDYAFAYNRELTNVNLGKNLISIGNYAFSLTDLGELTLPNTVKEIGEYAFEWNENLNNVKLNEGLENIGKFAFSQTAITSIDIPSTVKSIDDYAITTKNALETINIKGKTSLDDFDHLGDYPFYIFDGFTQVNFIN